MRQEFVNKRSVNWVVFKKLLLLLLAMSTGYLLLRQLLSILGAEFELGIDARRDMDVGSTPQASPVVSYLDGMDLSNTSQHNTLFPITNITTGPEAIGFRISSTPDGGFAYIRARSDIVGYNKYLPNGTGLAELAVSNNPSFMQSGSDVILVGEYNAVTWFRVQGVMTGVFIQYVIANNLTDPLITVATSTAPTNLGISQLTSTRLSHNGVMVAYVKDSDIFGRCYNANGSVRQSEFQVNGLGQFVQAEPALRYFSDEKIVAAWLNGGNYVTRFITVTPSSCVTTTELEVQVNEDTSNVMLVTPLGMTVLSDARTAFIWTERNETNSSALTSQIKLRYFDKSLVPTGPSDIISEDATASQEKPYLISLVDDSLLASWVIKKNSENLREVRALRYADGVHLMPERPIPQPHQPRQVDITALSMGCRVAIISNELTVGPAPFGQVEGAIYGYHPRSLDLPTYIVPQDTYFQITFNGTDLQSLCSSSTNVTDQLLSGDLVPDPLIYHPENYTLNGHISDQIPAGNHTLDWVVQYDGEDQQLFHIPITVTAVADFDSSSTGMDPESSTADDPTEESSSGGANPDSPGDDQADSGSTKRWLIIAGAGGGVAALLAAGGFFARRHCQHRHKKPSLVALTALSDELARENQLEQRIEAFIADPAQFEAAVTPYMICLIVESYKKGQKANQMKRAEPVESKNLGQKYDQKEVLNQIRETEQQLKRIYTALKIWLETTDQNALIALFQLEYEDEAFGLPIGKSHIFCKSLTRLFAEVPVLFDLLINLSANRGLYLIKPKAKELAAYVSELVKKGMIQPQDFVDYVRWIKIQVGDTHVFKKQVHEVFAAALKSLQPDANLLVASARSPSPRFLAPPAEVDISDASLSGGGANAPYDAGLPMQLAV